MKTMVRKGFDTITIKLIDKEDVRVIFTFSRRGERITVSTPTGMGRRGQIVHTMLLPYHKRMFGGETIHFPEGIGTYGDLADSIKRIGESSETFEDLESNLRAWKW